MLFESLCLCCECIKRVCMCGLGIVSANKCSLKVVLTPNNTFKRVCCTLTHNSMCLHTQNPKFTKT